MAIKARVIGPNFYTRINGVVQKAPIGKEIVVRGIPKSMEGTLEKIKEVPDSELVVNDTPTSAQLREDGDEKGADKLLSEAKEKEPAKVKKAAADKKAKEDAEKAAKA